MIEVSMTGGMMTESIRDTEDIMMIEDVMMIESVKRKETEKMTEADQITVADMKKDEVRMTEVVKRTEDLMILMTKVQVLVTMTENQTMTIRRDTRDQLVDTTENKRLIVSLPRSFLPVQSICDLRTTKMCLPPRSQR